MGRVPVVIAFSLVAAWGLVWSPRTPAAPPEKIERLREAKLAEKATEVLGGRLTVRLPSERTRSRGPIRSWHARAGGP